MLRILLSLLLLLPLAAMTEVPPGAAASDRTLDDGAVDRIAGSPIVTEATETPVLLVLGDSLSAAYGLPLDQGWVNLLQARIYERNLPYRVVNAAISGDTVAGGLSRLPALLAEYEPKIVLIELGANDGLRGFAPARIKDALVTLVEQAQAADADVVLIGVRLPPNYGSAYTERFQQLFATVAERTEVALVPRLLADVAEDPRLMQADGLHPTAEAQPLILETVWPVLDPLLE
ncbi:arylesterase [Halochromatium salexigens]|nr:arylesterase [Halochromatium salexigens]